MGVRDEGRVSILHDHHGARQLRQLRELEDERAVVEARREVRERLALHRGFEHVPALAPIADILAELLATAA